jgi:hypothetical protein
LSSASLLFLLRKREFHPYIHHLKWFNSSITVALKEILTIFLSSCMSSKMHGFERLIIRRSPSHLFI